MKSSPYALLVLALLIAPATFCLGQGGILQAPIQPTVVDDDFMQTAGIQLRFEASNRMSDASKEAMKAGQVITVPTFSSAFSFQGQTFPFTMVGNAPQRGGVTEVETQVVPISLFFDGFVDANGNNIVLDVTPLIPQFANSPVFREASYETGFTEFQDAHQRAEFFNVMKDNWHTLVRSPEMLPAVTVEVPANTAIGQLFITRTTHEIFAVIDTGFFISQLNTIIQLEHLDADALALTLTNRAFLAPNAKIGQCCIVGFHTAFDNGTQDGRQLVQTFAWASWAGQHIFGGTFQDVVGFSHEVSEWMNDPFGDNIVPRWHFPGIPTLCQSNLEVGDPLEVFGNAGFPVTIDGFTYHPQSIALLQWFERKNPSDAIDGAFSFPDQTLLTGPSEACPAGH